MKEIIWVWIPTEGSPSKINSEEGKLISWTCDAAEVRFFFLIRLEVLVFGPVEIQGLSGLINIYPFKLYTAKKVELVLFGYILLWNNFCLHECVRVSECCGFGSLVSLDVVLLPSLVLLLLILADTK